MSCVSIALVDNELTNSEGMTMAHSIIREFDNLQSARDYRHSNGTGGWIFEVEIDHSGKYLAGTSWLFEPHVTPFAIFNHKLTHGMTGRLIGSM